MIPVKKLYTWLYNANQILGMICAGFISVCIWTVIIPALPISARTTLHVFGSSMNYYMAFFVTGMVIVIGGLYTIIWAMNALMNKIDVRIRRDWDESQE